MKITKSTLKRIISEEMDSMLTLEMPDPRHSAALKQLEADAIIAFRKAGLPAQDAKQKAKEIADRALKALNTDKQEDEMGGEGVEDMEMFGEISLSAEEKIKRLEKQVIDAAIKGGNNPGALQSLTKMSKSGEYDMKKLKKKIKQAKENKNPKLRESIKEQDHMHITKARLKEIIKEELESLENAANEVI